MKRAAVLAALASFLSACNVNGDLERIIQRDSGTEYVQYDATEQINPKRLNTDQPSDSVGNTKDIADIINLKNKGSYEKQDFGENNPELKTTNAAIPRINPAELIEKKCSFENANELREHLDKKIRQQLPGLVAFYNDKFGMNVKPEDIQINYGFISDEKMKLPTVYPSFWYDFKNHHLLLEFIPKENSDEFAKSLCKSGKPQEWWSQFSTYQGMSIGFTPHEIAHWFHDRYMLENKIMWPEDNTDIDFKKPRNIGRGLVADGVAIYLASFTDPEEFSLLNGNRDNSYKMLLEEKNWSKYGYPAGEKLVRPILDKNFRKGIRILSKNPPEPRSEKDLINYQKRVLRQLD